MINSTYSRFRLPSCVYMNICGSREGHEEIMFLNLINRKCNEYDGSCRTISIQRTINLPDPNDDVSFLVVLTGAHDMASLPLTCSAVIVCCRAVDDVDATALKAVAGNYKDFLCDSEALIRIVCADSGGSDASGSGGRSGGSGWKCSYLKFDEDVVYNYLSDLLLEIIARQQEYQQSQSQSQQTPPARTRELHPDYNDDDGDGGKGNRGGIGTDGSASAAANPPNSNYSSSSPAATSSCCIS